MTGGDTQYIWLHSFLNVLKHGVDGITSNMIINGERLKRLLINSVYQTLYSFINLMILKSYILPLFEPITYLF